MIEEYDDIKYCKECGQPCLSVYDFDKDICRDCSDDYDDDFGGEWS